MKPCFVRPWSHRHASLPPSMRCEKKNGSCCVATGTTAANLRNGRSLDDLTFTFEPRDRLTSMTRWHRITSSGTLSQSTIQNTRRAFGCWHPFLIHDQVHVNAGGPVGMAVGSATCWDKRYSKPSTYPFNASSYRRMRGGIPSPRPPDRTTQAPAWELSPNRIAALSIRLACDGRNVVGHGTDEGCDAVAWHGHVHVQRFVPPLHQKIRPLVVNDLRLHDCNTQERRSRRRRWVVAAMPSRCCSRFPIPVRRGAVASKCRYGCRA